ncbi:HAMP domain-containing histidine kinase [Shewanella sp. 10N.7]|uniref:sensor histidine kinase n=1 Tax=Shewanella sp. 10N.7 TaxID=2885093 RepID=UPI001E3158B6|nr:HAMP domain-containing sensor histidine kinase [Shewanella sp. 10N.7]MCC4832474.1 HAMP domain-containing histidine kinase [Shewanella sp. 10N.7]
MKIRPSIKIYFLLAMFLTGTVTIVGMSAVAVSYFFSGLDVAMTNFVRSQASEIALDGDNPVTIGELTVATSWEKLPFLIQKNLNKENLEPNQMIKKIEGVPIIDHPKRAFFAMKVVTGNKVRYAGVILDKKDKVKLDNKPPQFVYILLVAFVAMTLFGIVLLLVLRKVASPVEKLREWAKSLDEEQLSKPVPNFHYSELNTLAEIVQSSLSSVQDTLDREKRFLGYASHELRTPIAVTRTNAELLRKMILKQLPAEKQLAVLDRIERAGLTMTDLTETLLWLNRQEGKSLPTSEVAVGELVTLISSELHYLLQGKTVKVSMKTDDKKLTLSEGLYRIIITNLIRNAFQHTFNGEVVIVQTNDHISITNHNLDVDDQSESDDLGFGLGLELTEKLVRQYGWGYEVMSTEAGRRVEVTF